MRIVILIAVAVILLAAGGGAAWWFLMGPGAEQTDELMAEINQPKPIYVPIDPPLVISLIQEGEVTHHVTVQLNLMLGDDTNLETTTRRLPVLRDALLTELHGLFSMRLVRDAGFESDLVKQRLIQVCDRQLGVGIVSEILLRQVEKSVSPQG